MRYFRAFVLLIVICTFFIIQPAAATQIPFTYVYGGGTSDGSGYFGYGYEGTESSGSGYLGFPFKDNRTFEITDYLPSNPSIPVTTAVLHMLLEPEFEKQAVGEFSIYFNFFNPGFGKPDIL